jgi:hypothetical protein
MMKKYLFYIMAAVIASGLTACSSNDDLDLESSAEQTFTSPYATIRASFGEEDATTRVAMDGLSLSWSEGDAIGVVYTNDANSEYKIIKYNYSSGGEFVVDDSQASDLETYSTPVELAFYPYSSRAWYQSGYGISAGTISYYDGDADANLDKIKIPLISNGAYDDGVYTFTSACGIFAVKVKNFKADMGYTKASLYNNTSGDHSGTWSSNEWFGSTGYYRYDFDLTKLEDGNPTFYFPVIAGKYYYDLTFALSDADGTKKTGFKLSKVLVPTANVKYAKVIELNDDGTRKDDAITLAKCELEVSNTVSVDLTNAASEETFYIPESVRGGTSVDITMSNVPSNKTIYLKQEDGVEIAKDVNLYYSEDFRSYLTVDLPNSNILIDSTDGSLFLRPFIVERAKTVTLGGNQYFVQDRGAYFKDVSEVTVNSFLSDECTIEGSVTGDVTRTMKLTINNTTEGFNITGNITLTVVNNTSSAVTFNSGDITAPANATTVLHIVDGKSVVED